MVHTVRLRDFRFQLEIDGAVRAVFSEVSVGEVAIDPVDFREGNASEAIRKITGLNKNTDVTLKRGIVDAHALAEWLGDIATPHHKRARRAVRIHLLDKAGRAVAHIEVAHAWPVKYVPSDLAAKGNEVAIETLELVNEGVSLVP